MKRLLRLLWMPPLLALAAMGASAQGRGATSEEEIQILLDYVNSSRAEAGVPALKLDPKLQLAAQKHAELMAQANDMEHQLSGEPTLLDRVNLQGVHFSALAENIAVSDSLRKLHDAWRKSVPHNRNLMEPSYNIIGIGIAWRGREVFAAEDFAMSVPIRSSAEIEQRVRDMLAVRGLMPQPETSLAREACLDGKWDATGPPPQMILRFAASDIERLGPVLDEKLAGKQGRPAAVGSCQDHDVFTRYRVAILVF